VYLTTTSEGGLGWSKTAAGALFSAIEVAKILGNPLAGMALDSLSPWHKKAAIAWALCATAMSYIVLAFASHAALVSIALVAQAHTPRPLPTLTHTPHSSPHRDFVAQGAVATLYGPGIAAISVEAVGVAAFPARTVRNEVAKHLGMLFASVLPMLLVRDIGYSGFFLALAAMAPVAAVAVLAVQPRKQPRANSTTTHPNAPRMKTAAAGAVCAQLKGPNTPAKSKATADAARKCLANAENAATISLKEETTVHTVVGIGGGRKGQKGPDASPEVHGDASSRMALLMRRDTLLFLGATILFHVANAGALPALGQKLDTLAHETADAGRAPVLFFGQPLMGVVGISMCIIVSQLAMIPVAIASKRLVSPDRLGLRLTLLLSYSTAPVRQCINAASSMPFVLLSAQLLDAAGDGCLGVVSVIVIEHLARGTPHFAFMQSVGTSCKGVGSAISSTLIATLVDHAGFGAAFSAAAIIAVSPIVVTLAMRDPGTGSALDNPLNAYYARRLGWIVITVLLLCGSCFAMITAWCAAW